MSMRKRTLSYNTKDKKWQATDVKDRGKKKPFPKKPKVWKKP